MKKYILLLILSLVMGGALHPLLAQGQAYRLTDKAVYVDLPSHWRNWEYQNDLVSSLKVAVDSTGLFIVDGAGIRPRYFTNKKNAALDAGRLFYQDIIRANGEIVAAGASSLSNNRLAPGAIDGSLTTYWEPAASDVNPEGLRKWELLVDLGQLVVVDSITVVFPGAPGEEDLGDPLKTFMVLVSMGEHALSTDTQNLKFTLLGKATDRDLQPMGTDGRWRQITFPVEPLDRADFDLDGFPDMQSSFLHYIKIKATDSDFDRRISIGEGDSARVVYEALSPERQGKRIYQRITAGGLLAEVSEEIYQGLSPDRQGPIRYFVGEVPRVQEVQVWTKGDNLVRDLTKRAGSSYEDGGRGAPWWSTDGLYNTWWTANVWSALYARATMWIDLGATFWTDGMYIVMNGNYFLGHEFLVSDGTLLNPVKIDTPEDFSQLENGLQWENIISPGKVDNRSTQVRMFSEKFAPRKVRFLQVRDIDISGRQSGRYGSYGNLAELQLYGSGYPVSVWLYSQPIRLQRQGEDRQTTLSKIAWEGEAIVRRQDPSGAFIEVVEPLDLHPEVSLQIQTRTSEQTDSLFTYFEVVDDGAGSLLRTEIDADRYSDLELGWRVWNHWLSLPQSKRHKSKHDDDGDGQKDEDKIDFIDNDGDGKIDEDGKKLRRAPRQTPDKDGELAFVGWSSWSRNYRPTGGRREAVVTSPSPRKFLQIRVNLQSEDPNATVRLKALRVDLVPPLALNTGAELALLTPQGLERPLHDLESEPLDYRPPREVNPLELQTYSYFIRAAGPDPLQPEVQEGFDEILILTKQPATLRGVRLGEVRVVRETSSLDSLQTTIRATETRFTDYFQRVPGDSLFRNAEGQSLQMLARSGSDSLYFRLPFSLNKENRGQAHAIAEVQLAVKMYRDGTELHSSVRNSQNPEMDFQQVEFNGQDATELVEHSAVRISLDQSTGELVRVLAMNPFVTPNGDGVNDQLQIEFALIQILQERPVEVVLYDLSGRLVGRAVQVQGGRVIESIGKAGELQFTWDGRSPSGALVPPGIYLCRIQVEADQGDEKVVLPIHVVY